ncbi:hypothetical protein BMS3Abin12_02068 [bacterium BMS3Abin12]|nr:hypothetical protein BMS3Abin12_02068 [bacterium BMS3Abin12]
MGEKGTFLNRVDRAGLGPPAMLPNPAGSVRASTVSAGRARPYRVTADIE